MATIKVSDQELKSILSELENELSVALGGLAKSEGDDEGGEKKPEKSASEGSSSEGGDKAPPAKEGGEGGEGGGDAPPAPEGSEGGDAPPAPGADAPPAPAADPSAPPAAPPAPATPAADGAPVDPAAAAPAAPADPAALQAEYAQLPPDQLKAHYLAAKAALFAVTQAAAPAPAPAAPAPAAPAAPMAPPAPAPAAAPAPMAPPVLKGEMKSAPRDTTLEGQNAADGRISAPLKDVARDTTLEGQNGVKKGEKMPSEANGKLPGTPTTPNIIAKSESDELKELKLQLEVMTKALSKIAGVPMQKAVTDLTYVAKSEEVKKEIELNPMQIKAKLNEVARNPLTKSEDRQLMNKYVCGGVGIDAIKHLLK